MDFGDLELDDDDNVPISHEKLTPVSCSAAQRPAQAETPCSTEQLQSGLVGPLDNVSQVAIKLHPVRTRIPGPAGRLQYQLDEQKSGGQPLDPDFQTNPWRTAQHHATENQPISSIGDSERVHAIVTVLSGICCSAGGNAHIVLKDPTGTLQGSMLRSCFMLREELQVGVVLLLQDLPVLHLAPGQSFCCISPSNIRDIFTENYCFEERARQGFAPVNQGQPVSAITTQQASSVHLLPDEPQGSAVMTDCTAPMRFGTTARLHADTPSLMAIDTPASVDTRQISSRPLSAMDIFHPSSNSPSELTQRPMLPSSAPRSSQVDRALQRCSAQQNLPPPDAAAPRLHAQPQVGCQLQSTVRNDGNLGQCSERPGSCTNPPSTGTTTQRRRGWGDDLRKHIRRKQQQGALSAGSGPAPAVYAPSQSGCSSAAPSPAASVLPGQQAGRGGPSGGPPTGTSLSQRIQAATFCPQISRPAHGSTCTPRPGLPVGSARQPQQATQLPRPQQDTPPAMIASSSDAPQGCRQAPPYRPIGASGHVRDADAGPVSKTSKVLQRLMQGNSMYGAHGTTAVAGPPTWNCHDSGQENVAAKAWLGARPNGSFVQGSGILQSRTAGRQISRKQPRQLEACHLDALDAAGLGYSQSPGDV